MEENINTPQQPNYQPQFTPIKQQVPNATGVLVLGILSIFFCSCYGIIGVILGIVALVLAAQGRAAYAAQPQLYIESSIKNLNAGRICAIVGICLSAFAFLFFLLSLLGIFAGAFSALPGLGNSL